jgi:hypothetical protein
MQQEAIMKEFGLPKHLASEIVAEETQKALRTRWQAWLWVAATLPLSTWLFFSASGDRQMALWLLIGAVIGWQQIGRHLASQSIREAARAKAARLNAKWVL